MFSLMDITFGGFQTSIIQFGLDQLHDASESATEITHICTLYSVLSLFIEFNYFCPNGKYKIFTQLFTCANLTSSVMLLFC